MGAGAQHAGQILGRHVAVADDRGKIDAQFFRDRPDCRGLGGKVKGQGFSLYLGQTAAGGYTGTALKKPIFR